MKSKSVLEIMSPDPVVVDIDTPIKDVEQLTNRSGFSTILVVDRKRNQCFGVISAPDLVRFRSSKKNPNATRAWEICSHRVISTHLAATAGEVAKQMLDNQIHHVVVSDDDKPVGIVSSLDLIAQCLWP